MITKNNFILFFICLGLAIALLFSFKSCNTYKQRANDAETYITSGKDIIKYLKDSTVAQRKTIQADAVLFKTFLDERSDLRKQLAEEKIKPKQVSSITSIVSHEVIQTKKDPIIIMHDTLPCPEFKPVKFSIDSLYYSIAGTIDKKNVAFTHIDFPDTLSLIAFTQHNFFRRNETKVSAHHSNKYIRITGLESINVRDNPKWWESRWIGAAIGLGAGYFLFHR